MAVALPKTAARSLSIRPALRKEVRDGDVTERAKEVLSELILAGRTVEYTQTGGKVDLVLTSPGDRAPGFAGRALRAARLDAQLFEEVENDPHATVQAGGVVVLAAVAAGVGSGAGGFGEILLGTVAALVSRFVWAYLAYWIGTRLLPEPATRASHAELLRTIGFASAPGVLRVLGVIGPVRGLVFLAAGGGPGRPA